MRVVAVGLAFLGAGAPWLGVGARLVGAIGEVPIRVAGVESPESASASVSADVEERVPGPLEGKLLPATGMTPFDLDMAIPDLIFPDLGEWEFPWLGFPRLTGGLGLLAGGLRGALQSKFTLTPRGPCRFLLRWARGVGVDGLKVWAEEGVLGVRYEAETRSAGRYSRETQLQRVALSPSCLVSEALAHARYAGWARRDGAPAPAVVVVFPQKERLEGLVKDGRLKQSILDEILAGRAPPLTPLEECLVYLGPSVAFCDEEDKRRREDPDFVEPGHVARLEEAEGGAPGAKEQADVGGASPKRTIEASAEESKAPVEDEKIGSSPEDEGAETVAKTVPPPEAQDLAADKTTTATPAPATSPPPSARNGRIYLPRLNRPFDEL